MSDTQRHPWTDNPYAPNILYNIYLAEKGTFAGHLVSSMLYGMRKTASTSTSVYPRSRYLFDLP